ncbi:MAG TPA: hypothetical protein VMU83_00835 [Hanamia sp.]|nr:hypothetical protein [Hanamia sp.]
MIDYKTIKKICGQDSVTAQSVVDHFLIHYAAKQNNLELEASQKLAKYKHITGKQDPSWAKFLKTQYIAHRIFRKDGLIKKYLNRSALKNLTREERNYLERESTIPWRFSFSMITANPKQDFYEMVDVFSEESFLLYSPGISAILKAGKRLLWFNLIGFNGYCWQSFGPINGYRSFEPDDIFFYATELAPSIEYEDDVIKDIDNNPVPYMMLLSGSEYPLAFHKDEQFVFSQGDYEADSFALKKSRKHFVIESVGNVHRYGLKEWNGFPHFAQIYHDEDTQTLLLTSMTDKGFSQLVETVNSEGLNLSEYPGIRLNPTMLTTAGEILKKQIELNEYEKLFIKKSTPIEQKKLDKINNMIELMLPDINAGKHPDL